MLQYIEVFSIKINMYKFFFYVALATVPIVLFALRKTFGFSKKQAAFYSVFTLAFGLISAFLTAVLKRVMLSYASGGTYTDSEPLRNYGIPIFLPVFLLIYCLLRKKDFEKLSDYIAPCVYSVMTIVKVGCVFWGCCYGEVDEHGIWNSMLQCRTYPVQLYDTICSLFIFLICLILVIKLHGKYKGIVYPIGGMLFALSKGYWESFRVHESPYERSFLDTGWTLWQYWLLVLFIGCAIWLLLTICKKRREVKNQ